MWRLVMREEEVGHQSQKVSPPTTFPPTFQGAVFVTHTRGDSFVHSPGESNDR